MPETVVRISGMSCQGCVRTITGVLQALPGVARVAVVLEAGQATITYDADQISVRQLNEAIEGAGFEVV